MSAPPLRSAISGTPSNATANTGFGALWDYVTGLLGATGDPAEAQAALELEPGVDVQVFDVDTAKTDTEQTWTAVQRTNELTDNDASFDLDAGYLDFKCTPTGAATLTFTNIPATPLVQKGSIILVNSGGYAISAHANTKVGASLLGTVSVAGTYQLSYRTSNGVVYVTSSGALA